MKPEFSVENLPLRLPQAVGELTALSQRVQSCWTQHAGRIGQAHTQRTSDWAGTWFELQKSFGLSMASGQWLQDWAAYGVDQVQRSLLTLDVLRQRGNNDAAHEAAGTPPVLVYEHELVLDGRNLPRPVNYQLLRIVPPQGVQVFEWKRPYMIIDPRAGHGAGIGGFKPDSQVGVALRGGHPVYFVVFRRRPEPGQTLADVMRAEAAFVREIARRHPDSPKPVVVGNCQGGWATLLLAAANPDITGPLVINGAPVATWSGHVGENPMRYNGGLLGGVVPAMLMADLGHGQFDGAHLVSNFEMLNPGRNFFGKYYDLFANVDRESESFLEFERWWGGYHFTNEAEIRWIIEQLFVGNRLARGEAQLEPGRHLDLKSIRSPIIVFASRGDNITPPQQALNWIVDTYADEQEIRIRGQRIVYMVHDKVGHLGIFVSSSIAKKEHTEMASTLKTIEALAPGLYEMVIDGTEGDGLHQHFTVSFQERRLEDIVAAVPNDRDQERDFAAVARLSELGAQLYEMTARPVIQSLVTPQSAELVELAHPGRLGRRLLSDENPAMRLVQPLAAAAQAQRQPADPANPWLGLEQWLARGVGQGLDLWRDLRDASYEATFLSIYGLPQMHWLGRSHAYERTRKDPAELRFLPEVQALLRGVAQGDYAAALIRMLVLLADSRGSVRRDRLERSSQVLTMTEPFASLGSERRMALIREQSVIAEFEPEAALNTLPMLLVDGEQRQRAIDTVRFIAGARHEMEAHSRQLFERMEAVLGVQARDDAQILPAAAPAAAQEGGVGGLARRVLSRRGAAKAAADDVVENGGE